MNVHAIILLLFVLLHNAMSCWFDNNVQKMACSSTAQLSAEGSDSWDKLHLYSTTANLRLKNDTFKRTPNLVDLTVANIATMELGTFARLSKLDKLSFTQLEMQEIPLGVINNLPIRNFQIIATKVSKISPGFFDNSPDLLEVDLRKNHLTEVEKGVFDNTSIYKLYLGNNKIEKLADKAFENMNDLIFLNLNDNLLDSFTTEQYLGTSNSLTQLWISKNKFTKLTKDMFTTIPNLRNLYVEFNQIESIERETFHPLPNLLFLDISNNKLRQIQPNVFLLSGMKKLVYISMQNNHLTFVNKAIFLRTPALTHITYGGNPFQCPCSQELDNLMKEKNITRICDKDYSMGERPSCIFSSSAPKDCLYDEDITTDLYELFHQAGEEYVKLELKCDTTKGISNGFLNNVDNVN